MLEGSALGQSCCVGSAGGLPGPPSQQQLGTWHLAPCLSCTGLALWPPRRRAPPFSSCRSCESFTVQRGGGPGWAPPRVQAGPIRQYILGSRQLLRGEASSTLLPAGGSWQSWRSPGSLSGTSSGRTLGGGHEGGDSGSQEPAQNTGPTPLLVAPASRLHCPPPPLCIPELLLCRLAPEDIPRAPHRSGGLIALPGLIHPLHPGPSLGTPQFCEVLFAGLFVF